MIDDLEVITEFIIESTENLSRLDREMVELEKRPTDSALLANIFRTIHTIKGTCGFLGFSVLERITHHAENILSQIRDGKRTLTPALVSLILETVDAIKVELSSIEATSSESGDEYESLVRRQEEAALHTDSNPIPTAAAPPENKEQFVPVAAPPATPGDKGVSVADSTIRVDVGQLDKLMNLVGELVLARNQLLQFSESYRNVALSATSQRLNLITSELQEGVMKTRMQPIGIVWSKLPRVVRDLATSCGKQIDLVMEGAETDLDKTIIEAIKDPLTHIVRNSCDHGVESPSLRAQAGKSTAGKLTLRAFHQGGNVIIEIIDDGGGIDPQKVKKSAIDKGLLSNEQAEKLRDTDLVNLVFLPGFSTAAQVSNISGRGVGMDVVKTNIEKIGGAVDLISKLGQGTTVRVRIPLTLAIIPGLVVTVAGERFVIPQASLIELLRVEASGGGTQIEWIHGSAVCRQRGRLLPLLFLNEALRISAARGTTRDEGCNIIVLQAEDRNFGLVVDGINDTQEIVVKPLGKQLKGLDCYAGATIMGDGRVALILDVLGLAQILEAATDSSNHAAITADRTTKDQEAHKESLLLFRAGDFERIAVPLSLVARLEDIPRPKIEYAAGRMVVQYRGQILPLVHLRDYLGCSSRTVEAVDDPLHVVVFSDEDWQIGLVVDQVLDIVEDVVTMKQQTSRTGLLGSGVVGGKVVDFLDLQSVIKQAKPDWVNRWGTASHYSTILLAESSAFTRSLLRTGLEIAGHRVLETGTASDAIDCLRTPGIDAVLASVDLPGNMSQLMASIQKEPGLNGLPVFALTYAPGTDNGPGKDSGFAGFLNKFDQVSILQSLENLGASLRRPAETAAPALLGRR